MPGLQSRGQGGSSGSNSSNSLGWHCAPSHWLHHVEEDTVFRLRVERRCQQHCSLRRTPAWTGREAVLDQSPPRELPSTQFAHQERGAGAGPGGRISGSSERTTCWRVTKKTAAVQVGNISRPGTSSAISDGRKAHCQPRRLVST